MAKASRLRSVFMSVDPQIFGLDFIENLLVFRRTLASYPSPYLFQRILRLL